MPVRLYTDGACSKNPGPGGWAVVCCAPDNVKTFCGGSSNTTNNEMELTAISSALDVVSGLYDQDGMERYGFEVLSDSAYVVNAINSQWVNKWSKCGWLTTKGDPVKNRELWEHVLYMVNKFKKEKVNVRFTKVRGHSGNQFNEMADGIAKDQARAYGSSKPK